MKYIEPLANLIARLTKLPGVGEKTAARFAYSILDGSQAEAEGLAQAILDAKSKVRFCRECGNYSEDEVCEFCVSRDKSIICVVKEPKDIAALEKTKEFRGVYHVLHGVISPMERIGPDDIKVKELLSRLSNVTEVIIATNPDIEGEATALYLARLIKPLGIRVTRIAQGLPAGSVIEYADEHTLSRALQSRIEI
ncbi:MAG: recombination mediator RecR [Christensenellales bacterium]|jgi:recombination protein RecR|nr:recombination mediator RecR [Clostridia bacterium]HRU85058.1 recombination mediator RecR [Eubacteriales bacterium]